MKFNTPLIEGTLVKRYKRFLADVELYDGTTITAHTPNTGSMKGCCTPGSRVWLRDSGNPKRKYPLSWELIETKPGVIVGINTLLPNKLVNEAIKQGVINELQGYSKIRPEVRYGNENSRIDLLLEDGSKPKCFVEIKNVTLVEDAVGLFPDAISERGTKHLRELTTVVKQGNRGIIFYCLQRNDAWEIRPADMIDPVYGKTLREAISQGVEALAYRAHVTTEEIYLCEPLPVVCS